jgi:hypothetical protein
MLKGILQIEIKRTKIAQWYHRKVQKLINKVKYIIREYSIIVMIVG